MYEYNWCNSLCFRAIARACGARRVPSVFLHERTSRARASRARGAARLRAFHYFFHDFKNETRYARISTNPHTTLHKKLLKKCVKIRNFETRFCKKIPRS